MTLANEVVNCDSKKSEDIFLWIVKLSLVNLNVFLEQCEKN